MPLALLLAAALSPIPPELGPPWATFSRAPALERTRSTIEIGTLGYDRERKQLEFWLRRTVAERGIETVRWADSRACPAVRPMVVAMRSLAVPRVAPPGYNGSPVVLDGVSYRLNAPSDQGEITLESNVETPLAHWVETSIAALEPCWTNHVPKRTGG